MRWIAKALAQKFLSFMPFGESADYFLQTHMANSLPISDWQLFRKVEQARTHLSNFRAYCSSAKIDIALFYEFGTGWDLIIPLTYHALGVRRQTLIDLTPHLRFSLINDSIRRLVLHKEQIERSLGCALDIRGVPISSLEELYRLYGIEYRSPADARATGLPSDSVDFISNTETFEHIPPEDILEIMKECKRVLKHGGVASCDIDLRDHFAYFDKGITFYNFLKFGKSTWDIVNSPLQFQNRLRYPDYLTIVGNSGLELVHQKREMPSAEDLALLGSMRLSGDFRGKCSLDELGVKNLLLVARKT